MPEDFKKEVEEALYKAYRPIISGMVRRGMITFKNIYEAVPPDVSEDEKRQAVLKGIDALAKQIQEVTGEEA